MGGLAEARVQVGIVFPQNPPHTNENFATITNLIFSARTIRSKITALLPKYLTPFAEVLQGRPVDLEMCSPVDWSAAFASLKVDTTVPEVTWIAPGPSKVMMTYYDLL
jgi:hypothetical protein